LTPPQSGTPWILGLLAMAWLPMTLLAEPLLPPTYLPGKTYLFQTTQHMEAPLALGAGGSDAKQVVDFTLDFAADCKRDPEEPTERVVTTQISRVRANMNMGNIAMDYDSDDPNSGESVLSNAFGEVKGEKFVFYLNEADEIVDATANSKLEGQSDDNFMQIRLGKEQIKQMVLPALKLGVPAGGVELDSRWTNDMNLTLGPAGNIAAKYQFHYVKDEGDLAVVEYTADLSIDVQAAGGENDPKVPVEVKDGEVSGFMKIDKTLQFLRLGEANIKTLLTTDHPLDPTQKLEIPVTMSMGFELLNVE